MKGGIYSTVQTGILIIGQNWNAKNMGGATIYFLYSSEAVYAISPGVVSSAGGIPAGVLAFICRFHGK